MTTNKILVIVESPGKIQKIKQYLGDNYIIKASFGHIQDLDKNTLSIDIENNFTPLYIVPKDKLKIVNELKKISKQCKETILASDGDREGEAIAYSLATLLKLNNPKRIIFNEITKIAIQHAINNPTTINYNMVYAQQARRLLDRLVGYKISPLLWKYISYENAQSAGRVQSSAVKIIIDKENEIKNSTSILYFKSEGIFLIKDTKFKAQLKLDEELKSSNEIFTTKTDVVNFLNKINNNTIFKIINIYNKKSIKSPQQPYITSSLQQDAHKKLNFSVSKTMKIAQNLYEKGFITYMRSDCPHISATAINDIKNYIIKTYGKDYSKTRNYISKNSSSQDAHECIRPTKFDITDLNNLKLSNDDIKLYNLIWKRTIASQMTDAHINQKNIIIDLLDNNKSLLIFNNLQAYFYTYIEIIEFLGFLIIYNNQSNLINQDSLITETETEPGLQNNLINKNINKQTLFESIKLTDPVIFDNLHIFETFSKLPTRYNEASLVKFLEKNGIGRPSTYSTIISKILDRQYVELKNIDGATRDSIHYTLNNTYNIIETNEKILLGKEINKFVPTSRGIIVYDFMLQYFTSIIDINFTAEFETYLDKIAIGQANWITILKTFYDTFNPIVEELNNKATNINSNSSDQLLGTINNTDIYIGNGKYGPYIKSYDTSTNKWKYVSTKNLSKNITLELANELLLYPKYIGKINNHDIYIKKGKFGLYFNYNNNNYSIATNNINIDYIKNIIKKKNI